MYSTGIQEVAGLEGYTDGTFKPSQMLTKGGMAVEASRIIRYVKGL
ncbi:S-layer homology domain-containing protein [Chengkuizengella marina]|nr:S-layer homology domain-containing protein [Chengkuizengella marina]